MLMGIKIGIAPLETVLSVSMEPIQMPYNPEVLLLGLFIKVILTHIYKEVFDKAHLL